MITYYVVILPHHLYLFAAAKRLKFLLQV